MRRRNKRGPEKKYLETGEYSKESMEKAFKEYLAAVTESYGEPFDDRKPRKEGEPSLRDVAEEWRISLPKARQLLITAGAFSTELSRKVQKLHKEGITNAEIAERLQISRSSVGSYLPYVKRAYSMEEAAAHTLDTRRYRVREKACRELINNLETDQCTECLEEVIRLFEKYEFRDAQLGRYFYAINKECTLEDDWIVIYNVSEKIPLSKGAVQGIFRNFMEMRRKMDGNKTISLTNMMRKEVNLTGWQYVLGMFRRFHLCD